MAIYKDLNDVLDNEYDFTKLLIPTDVLDEFKEMYLKFTGNNPNPKENIQRVEITGMDNHFNKLNHSNDTFNSSFYDAIAKDVGQRNFIVKGYLTWSVNHQFEAPATVQIFPFRGNCSVPPLKICFFLVDQSNNYYLQVWKNSTFSSKILQNPELVRVAYRYMSIFPGTTMHGGGFKNLHSIGNYRIHLHIYMTNTLKMP